MQKTRTEKFPTISSSLPLLDTNLEASQDNDGKLQPSGFWLTSVWIRNWHAISDLKVDIPKFRGMHLSGDTGTGKTSILDAVLWGLIGDLRIIGFNRAASSRGTGDRNLSGYVRCELQNSKSYRRDKGTSYILLGFKNYQTGETITCGSFIDFDFSDNDIRFITTKLPLTRELVANDANQRYTAAELRKSYRLKFGESVVNVHNSATEYRNALLGFFEGLPSRFFETISHLTGQQEPTRLNEFIREFLFGEDKRIDISDLVGQVKNLRETRKKLQDAERRTERLQVISDKADEWANVRQQSYIYRLCNQAALLERNRQEQERYVREISEMDAQQNELQAEQLRIAGQVIVARESADEARDLLNNDRRTWEKEQVDKQLQEALDKLAGLVNKQKATELVIKDMRQWSETIPQLLSSLEKDWNLSIPNGVLENLAKGLSASPINPLLVMGALDDLIEWGGSLRSTIDQKRISLLEMKRQCEERLSAASRGEGFSDWGSERAYKVRDLLRRHGKVDVLCDLIDSADEDWQPIVERTLGMRRFALIAEDGVYHACKRDYMDMNSDLTEGVILTKPSDVHSDSTIRKGSLAEKVRTKNLVARCYLNMHLNSWSACETDAAAEEYNGHAISKFGLQHSHGAIMRVKPLKATQLVFGQVAKKAQAAEAQREMEEINGHISALIDRSSNAASLVQGIKGLVQRFRDIKVDIYNGISELETEIEVLRGRQIELEQNSGDLFELQEKSTRLKKGYESLVGRQGWISSEIETLDRKKETYKVDLRGVEANLTNLEESFLALSPDATEWRAAYDLLISDYGNLDMVASVAHERELCISIRTQSPGKAPSAET